MNPDATDEDEEKSADFVELFFDLVFVLAITQLAAYLREHLDASGLARAGLVLFLLWWAWSQYTWLSGEIDYREQRARIMMLLATAITFFMATAVHDAFGDGGPWFGLAYLLVMSIGVGKYAVVVRDRPGALEALGPYALLTMLGAILVAVGGFVGDDARVYVWLLAAAVTVAAAVVSGKHDFRMVPSHFAERHGLITIIALGEVLIAIGLGAVSAERDTERLLTVAMALVTLLGLWWAMFDQLAGYVAGRFIELRGRDRSRFGRDAYTLGYLPIIGGIVLYATIVEEVVLHPTDSLGALERWTLLGGLMVFLLGALAVHRRAGGSFRPDWLGIIVVMGLVAAIGSGWEGRFLVAAGAGLLVLGLVIEQLRVRDQAASLRAS